MVSARQSGLNKNMLANLIALIVSLAAVVKGADWFLGSVEAVGRRFRLPPFVLGVLLVGFGTSLPELATSISSIASDNHNVAIANIIGSNMANILLILGISTFFLGTIRFKKDLINLDLPHLFCVSVLFGLLIIDGNLSFYDGLALATGFVVYLLYSLSQKSPGGQRQGLWQVVRKLFNRSSASPAGKAPAEKHFGRSLLLMCVSIVILAAASRLAVESMLNIANIVDLAVEVVTFVTIALGTSLPELLVTFKALRKGKGDLVLGNIIGSSVFNILLVGGVAALIHPQLIDGAVLGWSLVGLMTATAVLVFNGITKNIHVWEGVIFILIYIGLISKIVA